MYSVSSVQFSIMPKTFHDRVPIDAEVTTLDLL